MSDDFVLRIFSRGRPDPVTSILSKADALTLIEQMPPADVAKMFGVTRIPRANLERRDLLRVATLAAWADTARREDDDFHVSWLDATATAVRSSDIDRVELVDLDSLPTEERRPYRSSGTGFALRPPSPE